MRSLCTTTKSSPRSLQLEKARGQQQRPNAAKSKTKKKNVALISPTAGSITDLQSQLPVSESTPVFMPRSCCALFLASDWAWQGYSGRPISVTCGWLTKTFLELPEEDYSNANFLPSFPLSFTEFRPALLSAGSPRILQLPPHFHWQVFSPINICHVKS